jgi:type I restriction enzyme M protein
MDEIAEQSSTLVEDTKVFFGQAKAICKTVLKPNNQTLKKTGELIAKSADISHDIIRQIDYVSKLLSQTIDRADKELGAKENGNWPGREVKAAAKALEDSREAAVEQLNFVRYFYRNARWLQERFPDAELRNVEGLVRVATHGEIEKNDWTLTPGPYVGVALEEEDEDFDFEETLRELHVELEDLNADAVKFAAEITKNFKGLGI